MSAQVTQSDDAAARTGRKLFGCAAAWSLVAAGAALVAAALAGNGSVGVLPCNLAALVAALAAAGHGIAGRELGCLLDERNRFSLARAQLLVWAVVVFALLLSAVEWNIVAGAADPLAITIPNALLAVLGLSVGTAAAAPGLVGLRGTRSAPASPRQMEAALLRLPAAADAGGGLVAQGQVIGNAQPARASWRDLLSGDEISNAGRLDIAKAQQALLTLVLATGYLASARGLFNGSAAITALPALGTAAAALLAASHAGYLVQKIVPKADASTMTAPPTSRSTPGSDDA